MLHEPFCQQCQLLANEPGRLASFDRDFREFTIRGNAMSIAQDGEQLATAPLTGSLAEQISSAFVLEKAAWGNGIYGPFRGTAIEGKIE